MNENREPLFDKYQTADKIKNLVNDYYTDLQDILVYEDLLPIHNLELDDYYLFVKNIPYRRDTKPIEVISRPYYIVKHRNLGMDCKKKSILIASWAKYNSVPYQFIGSSSRKDKKVHHIFPQLKINDNWKNVDATYDHYELFEPKNNLTHSEVL